MNRTPKGWKLVPMEPTEAMIDAARDQHEGEPYLPVSLYKAMLAASPDVQQEPVAVINGSHCFSLDDANRLMRLPTGTKLYTAPQPASEVSALVEALEPFALAWTKDVALRAAGGYAPVTCPAEYYRRAAQVLQAGRWGMNAVDKENLAIGRAINRAAETLPEGCGVFITIERDGGFVVFSIPDGDVFSVDSGEPLSKQINSAVEAARTGGEA